MTMVFDEPEGAKGIAYLTADEADGGPTEWLYVPYVQRTRKLVPAGSDRQAVIRLAHRHVEPRDHAAADRRELYSPAGDLFKTETFGAVTRVDGIPTPLEMRITNVGTGSTTTLNVTSVSYDANVRDSRFDEKSLSRAADAGLWKQTPARPGK